ncbi:THA2 aldolase, partial [Edolisoma coerulescens]|nr:THA2 aldolase [Edolisoma coerulescens]
LMNAAVAQGVEPAQIAQHCDSVSLCFSKGLGVPCGAVLGGGLQRVGAPVGAAHLGLQHAEATLRRDHDNARRFAEGTSGPLGVLVCDSTPGTAQQYRATAETNIVMVNVQGAWPSPAELCDRLRAVSEEEVAEARQAVSVLLLPWSAQTVRAVWHHNISARNTELARRKLEFVARKCQE